MSFFRGIDDNWMKVSYLLTAGGFLAAAAHYSPIGSGIHSPLLIGAGVVVVFDLVALTFAKDRNPAPVIYSMVALMIHIGASAP